MGWFKRITGLFGILRDENHETTNEERDEAGNDRAEQEETRHRGPTRGFSVQVPVTVDRPPPNLGPVLLPCNPPLGGVQVLALSLSLSIIDFGYYRRLVCVLFD